MKNEVIAPVDKNIVEVDFKSTCKTKTQTSENYFGLLQGLPAAVYSVVPVEVIYSVGTYYLSSIMDLCQKLYLTKICVENNWMLTAYLLKQ